MAKQSDGTFWLIALGVAYLLYTRPALDVIVPGSTRTGPNGVTQLPEGVPANIAREVLITPEYTYSPPQAKKPTIQPGGGPFYEDTEPRPYPGRRNGEAFLFVGEEAY